MWNTGSCGVARIKEERGVGSGDSGGTRDSTKQSINFVNGN